MSKEWLYRRDGGRMLILDPDSLDVVGFVELPEGGATMAELERFRDWLMKQAANSKEPS